MKRKKQEAPLAFIIEGTNYRGEERAERSNKKIVREAEISHNMKPLQAGWERQGSWAQDVQEMRAWEWRGRHGV